MVSRKVDMALEGRGDVDQAVVKVDVGKSRSATTPTTTCGGINGVDSEQFLLIFLRVGTRGYLWWLATIPTPEGKYK